jgi:hypothetical protein
VSALQRIEQRRHQLETLLLARQIVRQTIFSHRFPRRLLCWIGCYGTQIMFGLKPSKIKYGRVSAGV